MLELGAYIHTESLLSPPVHFARWAHMRRFLSVCLDWTKDQSG